MHPPDKITLSVYKGSAGWSPSPRALKPPPSFLRTKPLPGPSWSLRSQEFGLTQHCPLPLPELAYKRLSSPRGVGGGKARRVCSSPAARRAHTKQQMAGKTRGTPAAWHPRRASGSRRAPPAVDNWRCQHVQTRRQPKEESAVLSPDCLVGEC